MTRGRLAVRAVDCRPGRTVALAAPWVDPASNRNAQNSDPTAPCPDLLPMDPSLDRSWNRPWRPDRTCPYPVLPIGLFGPIPNRPWRLDRTCPCPARHLVGVDSVRSWSHLWTTPGLLDRCYSLPIPLCRVGCR